MSHPSPKIKTVALALFVVGFLATSPAHAVDMEMSLVIKNHAFEPSELKVPANQRVKLTVQNLDKTPEEFESHALNREKVIPAGGKVVIYLGPLKPGRYEFMGEFNPATAKGVVVAE
jgi:Cupredoxin-like domain